MSFGQHAVVVEPSRFVGQQDELAERLAPVLRVSVSQVSSMLARGPVTVDADLDEAAARRLLKRLDSLGVPADLRDASGRTLSRSESGAGAAPTNPRPNPPPSPPDLAAESDAWGSVIPNLDKPDNPTRSSPDEPEELDDRSASLIAQFEETARRTDELSRNAPAIVEQAPTNSEASAKPPEIRNAPDRRSPPAQPPIPGPSNEVGETSNRGQAPQTAGPRQPPSPGPKQPPSPGPRQPPSSGPKQPTGVPDRSFDAGLITAALTPGDSDKPPYAPTGFDAAPPHLPGLAAGLSAVAPGAGQIYNGDDDEALDYGLKFFLIVPWVKSVQNAKRRGEKVASYWLPRPEEGALLRALKYLVVWWAAVAGVVTFTVFFASVGWEQLNREPVVEITDAEIAMAMEDAQTEVRLGRIAAMQALSEAQLNVPSKRFTMNDEERAQRLFIIGYQHCETRNYSSCESLMRRVASLKQNNAAQAFRLQAWASAAQSGNVGKFPAVDGMRTLSEFEAAELSEELGVPKPPQPKPEPAANPDAGFVSSDAGDPTTLDSPRPGTPPPGGAEQ